MSSATLVHALGRLEKAWAHLEAPIVPILQRGLSDEQIDDLCAPLGLTVPPELRAWWQWHDGAVVPEGGRWIQRTIGPGGYEFLPLADALDLYERLRSIFPDGAEHVWTRTWMPFMARDSETLYVDCAGVTAWGNSPVRQVNKEWEEPEVDRAQSLLHAVETWIWLLESGSYRWTGEHWESDWTAVPLFLRIGGLA